MVALVERDSRRCAVVGWRTCQPFGQQRGLAEASRRGDESQLALGPLGYTSDQSGPRHQTCSRSGDVELGLQQRIFNRNQRLPQRINHARSIWLCQTQLAGACDSFGAPLDLELAKDLAIVSFHRVKGKEEPLANLVIGESFSDEPEDFHLAVTQWRDEGLARILSPSMFVVAFLHLECRQ